MTCVLVRRHKHTQREGSHAKTEADKWRNAATSPGMPKTTWQTPGARKTQERIFSENLQKEYGFVTTLILDFWSYHHEKTK